MTVKCTFQTKTFYDSTVHLAVVVLGILRESLEVWEGLSGLQGAAIGGLAVLGSSWAEASHRELLGPRGCFNLK